jgi:hypothetical protein
MGRVGFDEHIVLIVSRRPTPPASQEVVCGSAALKRLLLDRSQPAEAPGELEERGRQVLARLADGERGDERSGGATAPAFLTIRRSNGFRYPGLGAICAIGTMGTGEQAGSRIA